MKAIFDWIKNSWVGTRLYDLWRMIYNDETGASMRKSFALTLMITACYLIIEHTDKTNLEWVLGEILLVILTLLGIVVYDNYKTKKLENDPK